MRHHDDVSLLAKLAFEPAHALAGAALGGAAGGAFLGGLGHLVARARALPDSDDPDRQPDVLAGRARALALSGTALGALLGGITGAHAPDYARAEPHFFAAMSGVPVGAFAGTLAGRLLGGETGHQVGTGLGIVGGALGGLALGRR